MELSLLRTYFSDTRNDLQTVGGHVKNGRGLTIQVCISRTLSRRNLSIKSSTSVLAKYTKRTLSSKSLKVEISHE